MIRTDARRAIVVLGAAMKEDGKPSPALRRRVRRGALLARDFPDLPIIVSGGILKAPVSEAAVMRDLLLAQGVAPDRIVCEDRSRNTLENLSNTRAIMERHGLDAILLVTDSFHMPRAWMTSWWLGVRARPFPVWNPTTEIGSWVWAHVREMAALPFYVFRLSCRTLMARHR